MKPWICSSIFVQMEGWASVGWYGLPSTTWRCSWMQRLEGGHLGSASLGDSVPANVVSKQHLKSFPGESWRTCCAELQWSLCLEVDGLWISEKQEQEQQQKPRDIWDAGRHGSRCPQDLPPMSPSEGEGVRQTWIGLSYPLSSCALWPWTSLQKPSFPEHKMGWYLFQPREWKWCIKSLNWAWRMVPVQ